MHMKRMGAPAGGRLGRYRLKQMRDASSIEVRREHVLDASRNAVRHNRHHMALDFGVQGHNRRIVLVEQPVHTQYMAHETAEWCRRRHIRTRTREPLPK